MSVALFKKAKAPVATAPVPLAPERLALAAAIQRVEVAKAAIAKAGQTRSEAADKIEGAEEALARIERDREKASDAAADFVRGRIAGETAEPPGLRRRLTFEQQEATAQRQLEAWRQIRAATVDVEKEQGNELDLAGHALGFAVVDVITAEASRAVEPMVARARSDERRG